MTELAAGVDAHSGGENGVMRTFRHSACIILLVVIAIALLHRPLIGGKAFLPADLLLVMTPWRYHARKLFPEFKRVHAPLLDVIQQYYPWRKFYAESIRDGELPLWNPYMFSGTTFVGNGQSAIFYPLNIIFLIIPVDVAFGWFSFIHLLIAALGMYALLSLWGIRPACSLIGALAFMMCGFLMAWLNYITLVCTAVWLPVTIAVYEYALRRINLRASFWVALRWAILTPLAMAMPVLAGHMQIAFYVWLSFAIYAAVRCGQHVANGFQRNGRVPINAALLHIALFSLAISFALMLSSPQLLPSVELSTMCTRAGEFRYEAVLANSLPPEQWVRLIVPHFFGNYRDGTHWSPFEMFNFIERTGYVGLLTLILASIGCAFKHPLRPYAILMLAVGFLFAVGSPICILFGMLPGVRQMVGVSRALLLFDFALAILASLGAHALIDVSNLEGAKQLAGDKRRAGASVLSIARLVLVPSAIAIAAVVLITAYGITTFWEVVMLSPLAAYERWQICKAAVLLLLSCVALTLPLSVRTRGAFALTAVCLIIVDLFSFAYDLNPSCDRRMVFFWTDSLRYVKANVGEHRIMAIGTDAIKHWMPSNTPMVYGLRDVQGSDSLWTARYANFLKCIDEDLPAFQLDDPDSQLLDLASVKFFVSGAPIEKVAKCLPKNIRRLPATDMWLYENTDVMPRAFMVSSWEITSSPREAMKFLTKAATGVVSLRSKAVVEPAGKLAQPIGDKLKRIRRGVRIAFDGLNRIGLEVSSSLTQLLVVSDAFYPGWRAYIDGKRVPVHIVNYAFRGVLVPQGHHSVWLVYEPTVVSLGIFCACIFAAFACGCLIAHWLAAGNHNHLRKNSKAPRP